MDRYVNKFRLEEVIEEKTALSISDIRKRVDKAQVNLSEEEIINYLKLRLDEDDYALKIRVQNNCYLDSAQQFIDKIRIQSYHFDEDVYNYFINYIAIVRNKTILLLDVIEGILNNAYILDMLDCLDIKIVNDNIKESDIKRLVEPLIYNLNKLDEYTIKANKLDTYLYYRLPKLKTDEIYPTVELQVKSLEYANLKGNVALSKGQIKELEDRNDAKYITSLIRRIKD